MSNLQQSDLILAGRFVDGDLNEHEAARVESLIAEDAEFAAAVEELRAQSSLLGNLPTFKPADDLADRTLQASMDQVKAIMGAWPAENADEKVTLADPKTDATFDWKSTVALVASLAGVLMIGAMLWQGDSSTSSNLALNEPALDSAKAQPTDMAVDDKMPETDSLLEAVADNEEFAGMVAGKGGPAIEESEMQKSVARSQMPDIGTGALSGTPMAKRPPSVRGRLNQKLVATSAPVDQIWCVLQDKTASRAAVSEILQMNKIAVQRESQAESSYTSPDPVDAFYVAATPKQMKLAMSEISNSANIEMIQLPGGANSPIADAVAQQFAQSSLAENEMEQMVDPNLPPKFEASSQALAQHLPSNALPRGIQLELRPKGPVPPILESGTPIDGLDKAARNAAELAMNSKAKAAIPAPLASKSEGAGGGGFGGGGGGIKKAGEANASIAPSESAPVQQQAALPIPQLAELDKYLDDSDQQLRQYLILVRGGELEK